MRLNQEIIVHIHKFPPFSSSISKVKIWFLFWPESCCVNQIWFCARTKFFYSLQISNFKLKVTPMLASSNILFLIEFLQKWIIKGLYLAALSRCDDRCLKHARYITFQGHCYSGCHGCQGTCWDLTTSARQPFWWVHNLWTPKRNKTEEAILSLSCAKLLMQRNFNAIQCHHYTILIRWCTLVLKSNGRQKKSYQINFKPSQTHIKGFWLPYF